jgi:hypothetical protein
MAKSFKEPHLKDLEKLPVDHQCQVAKTVTDDLVNTPKHIVWMKEKPIPYISNDKFSQEDIFHYWSGSLTGYTHVNQTYPDVVRMWRQFHGRNQSIRRCRLEMTKESSPMMMTHTGNINSLQCQEVGRRKGSKEVVVILSYSVALVWLV